MSSIAELRTRLKKRSPIVPKLPYRVAVDIILKLNREGKFGDRIVFTLDGQEMLTQIYWRRRSWKFWSVWMDGLASLK